MSEIKALDKLIDYIDDQFVVHGNAYERGMEIVDAIEAEIADRCMLLPVDADGVPTRYGDKLRSDELPGREFTCLGFNVTQLNGVPWWTVEWRYDDESGTSEYVSAKSCHHVKPRTLEELVIEAMEFSLHGCDEDELIGKSKEVCERIRELFGGDAE